MPSDVEYTRGEKVALIALGAVGIVALNTVFVFALLFQPELVIQAHNNPVSAVFIAEAILLMGFFAYFLRKWGVSRLGWGWFVVLSLLGSMAFALPVVLLWPRKKQGQPTDPPVREVSSRFAEGLASAWGWDRKTSGRPCRNLRWG